MKKLTGKIAIVTGASRGIGKGIALGLAEQGATVYIAGRTERDDNLPGFLKGATIHHTANEVNRLGGIGIPCFCDFRVDEDVKQLFARVEREQGRLDILANSAWAGADHVMKRYFWNTPFWEQPISLFDDFYTVGLRSSYLASMHAAKLMAHQKSGLIVNISFYSARRYWITPAHGVFKSATDKMTADTAHELKEYGIKVFSLYPGNVRTEGMVELAKQNSLLNEQDMESPQFIGRCVAALAFDDDAIQQTGTVMITGELAQHYGFTDIDGKQPVSLRPEMW